MSPSDEFANFEIWDHLLLWPRTKSNPNGSYIRQAFGRGTLIESKVGANPYKFGVVGASDFHNGLSASNENAFASDLFGIDPATMLPKGEAAKVALGIKQVPSTLDMDAVTTKISARAREQARVQQCRHHRRLGGRKYTAIRSSPR